METPQSLSKLIAAELTTLQPEYTTETVKWEFRGEVDDGIDLVSDMIALLQFESNTEEIYGNRTQRLIGSLTGQFLIGERTADECEEHLKVMSQVIMDYIGSLRYTEVGDAVVLQGTTDVISYSIGQDKQHYGWSIPLDLVVQF